VFPFLHIKCGIIKRGWSVGRILKRCVIMSDSPFNDKEEQFDRLWDGMTPKGVNRNKSLKFRQYILEHVRQTRRPMNKENALKYWMGDLQREIAEADNY
jgi:hypothetical protein